MGTGVGVKFDNTGQDGFVGRGCGSLTFKALIEFRTHHSKDILG